MKERVVLLCSQTATAGKQHSLNVLFLHTSGELKVSVFGR